MIKFTTGWPNEHLWSNARSYWGAKAKATKDARREAWAACLNAKPNDWETPEKLMVIAKFTPPMRPGKVADKHNMQGSIKAHLDGIQDAMNLDDKHFEVGYEYAGRQGSGKIEWTLMPFEGEID